MEIRTYQPEDKHHVLHLLRLNTPNYFAPEEETDLIFYLNTNLNCTILSNSIWKLSAVAVLILQKIKPSEK